MWLEGVAHAVSYCICGRECGGVVWLCLVVVMWLWWYVVWFGVAQSFLLYSHTLFFPLFLPIILVSIHFHLFTFSLRPFPLFPSLFLLHFLIFQLSLTLSHPSLPCLSLSHPFSLPITFSLRPFLHCGFPTPFLLFLIPRTHLYTLPFPSDLPHSPRFLPSRCPSLPLYLPFFPTSGRLNKGQQ